MHVANIELSEELSRLSGWKGTEWKWARHPGHREEFNLDNQSTALYLLEVIWFPAYDLGYLLRKLPQFIRKNQVGKYFPIVTRTSETDGETWIADYYGFYDGGWHHKYDRAKLTEASTPENAACKLAIELFKQGILTRES